ncbi:MAG: ABC transporter permease [Deltaproteobacteria bacterium]|nr:ABC transporter permease [Deltaproteobacteria bacterium]
MKRKSFYKLVLARFWREYTSRAATVFVFVVVLLAVLAPFLANNKPYVYNHEGKKIFPVLEDAVLLGRFISYPEIRGIDFKAKQKLGRGAFVLPPIPYSPTEYDFDSILLGPSAEHWMGTDDQGRDIASRMIHGAQISLSVGLVAVVISAILGIFIGAIAGFFGGKIDLFISRIIEVVMCFPTFFLILTILAVVEANIIYIMIVIGFTGWTGVARLVRGEFLKLKQMDFVISSQALGAKPSRTIFKHVLPNALSPVLVALTFGVASSIFIESSLSFLGFGVQPPTPSWGQILSQSREFMDIAWWLMVFPGVAIFLTITSFNLIGEGLRDSIDPRS